MKDELQTFRISSVDTDATGYPTDDGFIVLAGSTARGETVPSATGFVVTRREELIRDKLLVRSGDRYRVAEDLTFETPSGAAGVVLGRHANGWSEWKLDDGTTLSEVVRGWRVGGTVGQATNTIDVEAIIAESAPPERLEVRRQAESKARQLLEAGPTKWGDEDARAFFDLLDQDYYDGAVKQTRFGLAFRGSNRQRMLAEREILFPLLEKLYQGSEDEIEATIDETLTVSGAGRSLVSVLLYLRDRERFAPWGPRMVEGVNALAETSVRSPRTGRGYLDYNQVAQQVRADFGIEPEAMDAVLWQVAEKVEIDKPDKPGGIKVVDQGPVLNRESFALLAGLARQPDKKFYTEYKDELDRLVQGPIKRLLLEAAQALPAGVARTLETETHLFGSILKNDYGQGGAWPFYWGALYPKGGKKIEDAQLFVWVNAHVLDVGFSIGQNGKAARTRFAANCKAFQSQVREILESHALFSKLSFGYRENLEEPGDRGDLRFDDWLANPEDPRAGVTIPSETVVGLPFDQLRDQVLDIFVMLYPLVLLATHDDPAEQLAELIPTVNPVQPEHSIEEISATTGISDEVLRRWVKSIGRKGQAVFYGPPGTGKTFIAEHLAKHLIGGGRGLVETVQFHPAYAYEDFMQGIRPITRADGALEYRMEPGRFRDFCERAEGTTGKCVMIVDEINRANLSRVFGELMYLLEYRKKTVPLAGGGSFRIPDNVILIGTMNTADRSIALVDHALRRRFAFIPLRPDYAVLSKYLKSDDFPADGLVSVLKEINDTIGDPNYALGISFFMRESLESEIEDIWAMEIEPYLEEYFYGQSEKFERFRWIKVQSRVLT